MSIVCTLRKMVDTDQASDAVRSVRALAFQISLNEEQDALRASDRGCQSVIPTVNPSSRNHKLRLVLMMWHLVLRQALMLFERNTLPLTLPVAEPLP